MEKPSVLILTAGRIFQELVSLFGEIPSGMIPINSKPAISWTLDELLAQGFDNFYITIGFKKDEVKKFIDLKYSRKCKIHYVEVDFNLAPGNSIITALKRIESRDILIVLGDTIVKNKLSLKENCVYTSMDFMDSKKWCLVKCVSKGNIEGLYDKMEIDGLSDLQALVGIYYLQNASLLRRLTDKLDNSRRIEISRILEEYLKFENIKCIEYKDWVDIGHLDKYHKAKIQLASARYFNNFKFDSLTGVITKRSLNKEKLINEARWYKKLPRKLSVLAPRIIDCQLKENPFLKLEYYGYSTLAELFVYGDLHYKIWEQIIHKLMDILHLFTKYKRHVSLDDYYTVYLIKTQMRISELLSHQNDFKEIFSYDTILINGEPMFNFYHFSNFIKREIDRLYLDGKKNNCFIHGDFCLGNILFDPKSGIIRLIDPRGIWGKSLYGDIRYDVAKLRHSVADEYDLIVNDFFTIKREDNSFDLTILSKKLHHPLKEILDNHIAFLWDINQIKFIEGLLFLSMIPLHKDNKDRQLAMYCIGLKNLNEVYKIMGGSQ